MTHGQGRGNPASQTRSETTKPAAEKVVRDIRRRTRKLHSAEEKIRVVLEGLRGEESIAELAPARGDRDEPVLQLVEGVPRGREEAAGRRHGQPGDEPGGQGPPGGDGRAEG